ncbi:DUF1365 domain-containing protein [Pseudooceanicola algae]|uniref:Cyclopropane-fatty-acyl-phospholipid synthase n=1 Tax=Pseudooceanicola algae TaxID=1537215 RepID=A0A418SG55_9RHOB|nr:DUF1365 domain-containing protein [Pseudooceanicola algae]QPM91656.1 hypothetical protein PSAL_029110 [Pseudooceanicola algae]
MTRIPQMVRGQTTHSRHGAVQHSFRYGVDYVLIDPENDRTPWLFSRHGRNLASVRDRDHGGPRGQGRGVTWCREVLAERGLTGEGFDQILLLTQPAFFGALFNPVSFWLVFRGEALIAAIAEVNNTFGDRHSYLCAHPGFMPIDAQDDLRARKVFHVSPFRQISGDYRFRFSIGLDRIAILIAHEDGSEGLHATLTGRRERLTSRALLASALLRRPFGALRTIVLIYRQALALRLKGAIYRRRPAPPAKELS